MPGAIKAPTLQDQQLQAAMADALRRNQLTTSAPTFNQVQPFPSRPRPEQFKLRRNKLLTPDEQQLLIELLMRGQ